MKTAPSTPAGASLHRWSSLLAAGFLACALPAAAVTLTFERVTSNAPVDSASDYLVEILDLGGQALFLVSNGSDHEGFINQIYFEDPGSLLGDIAFELSFSLGNVDYTDPATPANPPGLSGQFLTAQSVQAVNPAAHHGIGDGETGAFVATYTGTFAEFEAAIATETFRMALHAQGLAQGQSDSFVSKPSVDPPIPEPSSLFLLSLGSFVFLRRRR